MIMDSDCRLIFDNLPGIYLILKPDAPDFTIIEFNKKHMQAAMFDESIIGQKLFKVFTDDINNPDAMGLTDLRASLMKVIETKQPHKMALQHYNLPNLKGKELEDKYWAPVNIPVLDKDKSLKYIIHVVEDVTEKVLLQQQISQSREELEQLHKEHSRILESIEDAFIATDRNWTVKYWNKQAEVIFNISCKDILGKCLWDFISNEGDGKMYEHFHKALWNNRPAHFQEYYAIRKIWLQANVYPSKEGITAVLVNITELKKEEEELSVTETINRVRLKQEVEQRTKELNESKELLQLVINSNLVFICVYKAIRRNDKIIDFEWVYANRKMELLAGSIPLKGKRYTQIFNNVVGIEIFNKFIDVVEKNYSINEEVCYKNEQEDIDNWLYVTGEKLGDGLIVNSSDITERKKAGQELEKTYKDLEQTKTTFEQMLNGSLAGIAILEAVRDEDGKIKDFVVRGVNKAAELFYQKSKEEIIGFYLLEMFPHIKDTTFSTYVKVVETGESARIQSHFIYKQTDYWFDVSAVKNKDGFILTYLDITELKITEQELKKSKDLLQSVLDVSLNSICFFKAVRNEKGDIIDFEWVLANHAIEQRVKQGPLIGKRFTAVYQGVEMAGGLQKFIEVVETGVTADFEYCFELNGTLQWLHVLAQKFDDGLVVTTSIITERKKAELELTESKSFIEKIATTIPDLITIHDLSSNEIVYTNTQNFWDNYFNPDEIYKMSDEQRAAIMVSPDYLEQVKLFLQERKLLTDDQTAEVELKLVNSRWIKTRSKVFKRDEKGHTIQLISVTTDITKRKNTEQELLRVKDELAQRATDKYLRLFNSIDQGFCVVELVSDENDNPVDIRYLEVNPAFEKITGIKNAVGRTSRELEQDVGTDSFNMLGAVLFTGVPVRFERWTEPLEKWVEVFAFQIEQTQEHQIAILFNDITTRKSIELWQTYLLKLSDALRPLAGPTEIQGMAAQVLGMQLHASRCFYSEIVSDKGIEYFSVEAVYHTPDAPLSVNLHPVDSFGKLMNELRAGHNVVIDDVENTLAITPEDRTAYNAINVHAFVAIPLIKNDKMVALLAVHQTAPRNWKQEEVELMQETAERTWAAVERAKAEEAVRSKEQRFRAMIENISDGLAVISPTGTIKELSISAQKILGYDFKFFKGQNYRHLFFPADFPDIEKAFKSTLELEGVRDFYAYYGISNSPAIHNNPVGTTVQFRFVKQEGGVAWLEGTFHNLLHEESIRAIVFTFRDITSRRKQEQQLQASEEKYRYLFQNNPAAIIIWTLEDYWIREVNEAASMLYGYTHNEFLSKTFLDLKPEEQQRKTPDLEPGLTLENISKQGIWQHKTKQGNIIYMNFSFHRINYSGMDAVLTMGTNVTENITLQKKLDEERQRKQKEITEAVITAQENERAELGRELHDNISQVLTTARMYIEYSLNKKEKQAELLHHSREYISKAVGEIRQISHRLMLPSLDDVSLKQSLEELFINLKCLSDFKFRFDFLLPNEKNLSDNLKLGIFRIVQEGLNNVFRHAKATKITVHIEQREDILEVCIEDNGIGFDHQGKIFGLGLRNITSRANLFGGNVKLNSHPGKGTELRIEFPVNGA